MEIAPKIKGIIYELRSLDPDIKDTYTGSSEDLNRRITNHKSKCNNPNDTHYNLLVYTFIRANGGWDNWKVNVIEEYDAIDRDDLHRRERYWIETIKSTLNGDIPTQTTVEGSKKYREKNRDIINAKQRKNRADNHVKLKAQRDEYTEKNKDKIKQKDKEWYENNKEHVKEYREENAEAIKAKDKAYYIKNRERLIANAKINKAKNKLKKQLQAENEAKIQLQKELEEQAKLQEEFENNKLEIELTKLGLLELE